MSAIIAPLVIILMAFAAYGLGSPFVRRIDKSSNLNAGERLLISGLTGAAVLAGAIWLVGSVRYGVASMAALLAVSVVGALIFRRGEKDTGVSWRSIMPEGVWRLVPVIFGVVVIIGIIGSYAPPSDHDTLRYQLYLPDRDLNWGRIGVEFGWSIYEYLPPLGAMLTRMAFALGGPVGAQLLNVLWQVTAAGTAAALTYRLARRSDLAWLAALFLVGQRVSINLASAVTVEFVLASYAGAVVLAALAILRQPNMSMGLLLGLIVGGLVNVKHHGLAYAASVYLPLLLVSLRQKNLRSPMLLSGIVAFAMLGPWLARNWVTTGNPVFPAFHNLFGPDNINLFEQILNLNHDGSDYLSVVLMPWTLFVDQFQFDGLQFGIPFLLLFLPFAFIAGDRHRLVFLTGIVAAYLSVWFLVMPHYIRFLVPVFPILCALAALGAGTIGDAAGSTTSKRRTLLALAVALGVAQAGFLAATAVRRVPAALNLTSAVAFLESNPFKWYSQFRACRWVSDRLSEGEAYLALLNSPSYYCSAARAFPDLLPGDDKTIYTTKPRPAAPPQWLANQLLGCRVKYVIRANNLGTDSEPYVFAKHRYDSLINSIAADLVPVFQTPVATVYDGTQVAEALLGLPSISSTNPLFSLDGAVDQRQCAVTIGGFTPG